VGLEGSGVPRQQLDPAVLGDVRAVRDLFPTITEAINGERLTSAAVLQSLDGADRPDAAAADRRRSAAGVAQVHDRELREQFMWPWRRRSSPACIVVPWRARLELGLCFALSASSPAR
jgi:hypothetical protein